MAGGLILAVGTVAGLFAQKTKIPDVAVFLVAGMMIGPQALGLIDIKADFALYQILLLFGASYILFDGGASLRFHVMKQVWITIIVIATVGVLITAIITSTAAHFVLGVPWIVAALLGATLASTDPATLVPIFRQVHVRDRVAQTVMCEFAFNDATGAIVTFGVLTVAMGTGEFSLSSSLLDLLTQAALGIAAGAILGYLAALLIAHERWAFFMEYAPVVTIMAVIGAYFAADGMRASGFMAVFVFGIMLGNKDRSDSKWARPSCCGSINMSRRRHSSCVCSFLSFWQRSRFRPDEPLSAGRRRRGCDLHVGGAASDGFARTPPDRRPRWSLNEMLFMCWTRETGVIPPDSLVFCSA